MRAGSIALVILVVAFFAVVVFRIQLPFWRVEATLHPTVSVVGRTVHVTGTTDLPDGAILGYYYWNDIGKGNWPDGGYATIGNGRFEFKTDFNGWPGGVFTVYVEFAVSPEGQPQVVLDRFGNQGERLSGPQAYSESGDPPVLQATVTFVVPS